MQNQLYQRRFISSPKYELPNRKTLVSAIEQFVGNIATKTIQWFKNRHRQHINRLAFQQVLSLDDHMLNDIGVSREDVIRINKLPKSINAARELEKAARMNKKSA